MGHFTISLKSLTFVGAISSAFYWCFGSENKIVVCLLLLVMGVDFLTGLSVAILFKKSPKTTTGTLSSNEGFKGFIKKVTIILCVMIAHYADIYLNVNYVCAGIATAFIGNELISIFENMGLMGIPLPQKLIDIIDLLKSKEE